jgi:hypothetical protein
MDSIIQNALSRLDCEPEVVFDQTILPTRIIDTHIDTPIYTYEVPPHGDIVTWLSVQGLEIRHVCVKIMGSIVYADDVLHTDTIMNIPVMINLLRLGYHRARIQVTGTDVNVMVTFKLFSDDMERRRIATCDALYIKTKPSCSSFLGG